MSLQETKNVLLTYQDVVACFSQQEWEFLHKWQTDLYANLMKEINQVLMSLGPVIAKSVFSLRAIEREDLGPLDKEDSDRSHRDDHCSNGTHFHLDVFSQSREETQCPGVALNTDRRKILDHLSPARREIPDQLNTARREIPDLFSTDGRESPSLLDTGEKVTTAMISVGIKSYKGVYPIADLTLKDTKNIVCLAGEEVSTAMISPSIKEEEKAHSIVEQNFEDVKNITCHSVRRIVSAPEDTENMQTQEADIDTAAPYGTGGVPASTSGKAEATTQTAQDTTVPSALATAPTVMQAFQPPAPSTHHQWLSARRPGTTNHQATGDLSKKVSSSEKQSYAHTGCEKDSTWIARLELCERNQRGKRLFECTECGKSFTLKSGFRRHLRIHTGEKPFSCTECERRFNQKEHLEDHLRLHSGFKPYPCSECEKRFTRNNALMQHLRIHTGERPFCCSVCEKSFTRNSDLKRHLSIHTEVTQLN
ncbi:zinc finger protein 583-like [Pleurodeles waltl]